MCITCNLMGLARSQATAQTAPQTLLQQTARRVDESNFGIGTPGVGDSLYSGFGNGGYDARRYNLDLNISDVATSRLAGVTTMRATATQNLRRFNMDFIGFQIDGITVNGRSATFTRDGQELRITPAQPVQKNKNFNVRVSYSGSPDPITSVAIPVPTGWVNFGDGSFVLSQPDGAANYYPVNDHPIDKAVYQFRVTVPKPFEVAANGVQTQAIDNGSSTTYVFNARDPMASYLTTVDISQFNLQTGQKAAGVPIRNYFAEGIDPTLLEPFDRQPQMMRFFTDIYGRYPFEVYGSVVMNTDTGTALETQTLSIFGTGQLGRTRLTSSTEEIIAHELAHQWIGNSVSLTDWRDIWLNEGFATYSQGLWIEYSQGKAVFDQWVNQQYSFVRDNLADLVPPGEPKADDLFNAGVYEWGAIGLHALRLRLGDQDFFDTLETYATRFRNGNVDKNDFRRVAEEISGQNLKGFFDRWFYSETLPPLPTPRPKNDRLVGETGVGLLSVSGGRATVTLTDKSDRNTGGFYRTDNPYGVVVDPLTGSRIAPGEAGYAKAALQQSVKLLDQEGETLQLQAGAYYVPYLLENGRPRSFVSPFTANRQVELVGSGTYRFSERSNLENRDFTDLVLQVAPIR